MEYHIVTISLPTEIAFRRAGVDVTVKVKDLPAEIVAQLVEHGIVQKVGDAAAGASRICARDTHGAEAFDKLPADEKNRIVKAYDNVKAIHEQGEASMLKVLDALYAGDWGVQRSATGEGLSGEEADFAKFCRDALGIKWADKIDGWKEMTSAKRLAEIHAKVMDSEKVRATAEKMYAAQAAIEIDI